LDYINLYGFFLSRTMDMTIDQQVALDESIVPHARRLRIGKSNFRLNSDISSKESTLQLAYDVLRLTPFYKAFLVIADVPEIYMQEFWTTATVHHHSIRNVDFAYLLWEDFNYQVEHKDTKKSNKMYYPKFTKVIVHYFMSKVPSILRRNRVNWHYARDDQMFTTIKLVSRHQNTQQFDAMLPIELTNADIKNSKAYKEYYAVTTGATPPKTKASVRKTKSSYDTTITPPPTTAAGIRLSTSAKGKQPAKASKTKSLTTLSKVAMTEAEQLKLPTKEAYIKLISPKLVVQKSSDEEEGSDDQDDDDDDAQDGDDDQDDENKDDDDQDKGDDDDDQEEGNDDDDQDSDKEGKEFIHPRLSIHDEEETKDKESFDPVTKTPKNTDDEGDGEENLGLNVGREEGQDEEDDEDELYRDVNINLEGRVAPTTVAPLPLSTPTLTPSTIATISTVPQAPTPPTTAPSNDDDQDKGDDDDDQEEGSDDEHASDEEGEEFIHPSLSSHDEEETRDEESFDPIAKMTKNTNDKGNGEENLGLNVGREEGQDEEDDEDEL
nr:hypothetical protein [Tanacetum cinerariifolium]